MRSLFWPMGALGAGLIAMATPALASEADDAWAACIWQQAPTSASNWLAMTPTKTELGLTSTPYDLLATRLQGFCHKALARDGKKVPSFKPAKIRSALVATRPASIGPDQGQSAALRCQIFEGDILLGVTIGFGEPSGITPVAPATAIKCQRIQDDGSLQDA